MAGWMIIVSFFATGAFAKRVATEHDIVQLQKEAVSNGPGILPGSVQLASPIRSAVMPRASVPVGMSIQEGGNPGKYLAELRTDWKGLETESHAWMSADDDQDVELALAEVAAADAGWMSAGDDQAVVAAAEKEEKYKLNVRQAYDSLTSDIPQILRLESEGKTTLNWDIYTDDLETNFSNPANYAALALFSTVASKHAPSWSASVRGKDLHQVVLQELRAFIDNFVRKAEVTGQDWCMDKDSDWCVLNEELSGLFPQLSRHQGDEVITSFWKTVLTMKSLEGSVTPEVIVTIQALSRFHLNDEGKIYRQSIDQLDIRLNKDMKPVYAELWQKKLGVELSSDLQTFLGL